MILKGTFPTEKFKSLATPFYFYDITLLKETLNTVKTEAGKYGYHVHYAVKANANPRILSIIAEYGLGADCVSGVKYRRHSMQVSLPEKSFMPVSAKQTGRSI